jgi:hypothetical protein
VTGKRVNNITVATFPHASGVEPASAFVASIDWGDGKTSSGTITLSGTTYTVKGSHTYSGKGGSHTVRTTVTESGNTPNVLAPFGAKSDGGDEKAVATPVVLGPAGFSSSPSGPSTVLLPSANARDNASVSVSDLYVTQEVAVLSAALSTNTRLKGALPQGPRALFQT